MSGSRKRSRDPSSSEDDSYSIPPPTKRRRDEDLMSLLLAKLSLTEDQPLKHQRLQSQQNPGCTKEDDQQHQSAVVALPADAQLPQLADVTTAPAPAPTRPLPRFNFKSRCAYCRRKPKLVIGFTCRCRSTFCELHRHPETHHCSFDYKQFGRDAISQANPLVLSDKLPCRI